jgi:hypothetical protein
MMRALDDDIRQEVRTLAASLSPVRRDLLRRKEPPVLVPHQRPRQADVQRPGNEPEPRDLLEPRGDVRIAHELRAEPAPRH